MTWTDICLCAAVLLVTLHFCWLLFTRLPAGCQIAVLPHNIPLFGNIWLFFNRPWFNTQKQKWFREYKDSFIVWFFTRHALFTRDIKIFEKILSSPKHLSKGLDGYWVLEEWLGNGLILSDGPLWRKRRKLITPTFHFDTLNQFMRIMDEQSKELVRILSSMSGGGGVDQKVNVFDVTKPFSMSIICQTAMGLQLPQKESGDGRYDRWFQMVGERMFQYIVYPWLWSKRLSVMTKDGSILSSALNNLHQFVKTLIEKRIESRKECYLNSEKSLMGGTSDRKNGFVSSLHNVDSNHGNLTGKATKNRILIDTLLDAYESGDIDITGILNEVNTFVNAGFETTSTALAWCLYLLGRNIGCQQKLWEELNEYKERHQGTNTIFSIQDLTELKYTDAVIKESMRIHPPVPVIARTLSENVEYDGGVIPSGIVIFDIVSMNRNQDLWEEPMSFKPERFLEKFYGDSNNARSRSSFSYIPFSAGPRNCVGQRFALAELKIALFHLVLKFNFTSVQCEKELEETFDFFHGSDNGLWLQFEER
eukprot:TCONS_00020287-protein